ncbi:AlpA family transcriptional regulator [Vibrio harveyi]|uniref:AlpA family transcriptional regulator n=1 Tax=Vibrio harveyi TaxID=669 RepID=UPI00215C6AE0|nr:AlpA family transcriptional regulator [Vibrio harveyi]MCR9772128.1 AlpA family transcriptional regulator [Vibrio harveyi]
MQKNALGSSAIYRKMETGEFPVSISLRDRAVAWIESEVDEQMERCLKRDERFIS